MKRVHLVGRSGHGKTTLSELLLAHWIARGLRVGSIKHTGHIHELDMPGKDSWRHRQAGAAPTTVVAGDRLALHLPLGDGDDPYALLAPHYARCDLVLVEGHLATRAPRIEVWRAALGEAPLAAAHAGIAAVISDDACDLAVPIWPRTDVAGIAERLLVLAG